MHNMTNANPRTGRTRYVIFPRRSTPPLLLLLLLLLLQYDMKYFGLIEEKLAMRCGFLRGNHSLLNFLLGLRKKKKKTRL